MKIHNRRSGESLGQSNMKCVGIGNEEERNTRTIG